MLKFDVKMIKNVVSIGSAALLAAVEVIDKQRDKKAFEELVKRVAELEKAKQ